MTLLCFLMLYFCVAIIHRLEWIYLPFFFFNMECSCEQPSLESPVPTSSGEKKHEVSVWKESVGAQGLYSGTAKSLVREMKEDLAEGRDNAQ